VTAMRLLIGNPHRVPDLRLVPVVAEAGGTAKTFLDEQKAALALDLDSFSIEQAFFAFQAAVFFNILGDFQAAQVAVVFVAQGEELDQDHAALVTDLGLDPETGLLALSGFHFGHDLFDLGQAVFGVAFTEIESHTGHGAMEQAVFVPVPGYHLVVGIDDGDLGRNGFQNCANQFFVQAIIASAQIPELIEFLLIDNDVVEDFFTLIVIAAALFFPGIGVQAQNHQCLEVGKHVGEHKITLVAALGVS
jgi:hypothetical protein